MARYKAFACPFFQWNEKLKIHCEGGCRVAFLDKQEEDEYINRHCGDVVGWQNCSLARSMVSYYDRQDKNGRRCQC